MSRDNNGTTILDKAVKFQNSKKQKYIENWNSRLFLHVDNDENPLTLADAFITPQFDYYIEWGSIKFSDRDSLMEAIEKFIQYDKTSNLLITGSPGIGKTSVILWIADKYRDDEDIIILRFRDWSNKDLAEGLFNAICNSLDCESVDLENKVLIIDGFDEIKFVNERKSLIHEFFNNTLDFHNLKVIITSSPDYLDTYDFQNAFKVLPFDISQIKEFYQIIKGGKLDQRMIDSDNLDVLGIPVILYMAIMTYYSREHYKNNIDCEMNIFANMLEVIHLWKSSTRKFNANIFDYIKSNKRHILNLNEIDLSESDLERVGLEESSAVASILREVNLGRADLRSVDLRGADLRRVDLTKVNLSRAKINASIWYKDDILKILAQLRSTEFTYIIVEDQEQRKLYRSVLFLDENWSNSVKIM